MKKLTKAVISTVAALSLVGCAGTSINQDGYEISVKEKSARIQSFTRSGMTFDEAQKLTNLLTATKVLTTAAADSDALDGDGRCAYLDAVTWSKDNPESLERGGVSEIIGYATYLYPPVAIEYAINAATGNVTNERLAREADREYVTEELSSWAKQCRNQNYWYAAMPVVRQQFELESIMQAYDLPLNVRKDAMNFVNKDNDSAYLKKVKHHINKTRKATLTAPAYFVCGTGRFVTPQRSNRTPSNGLEGLIGVSAKAGKQACLNDRSEALNAIYRYQRYEHNEILKLLDVIDVDSKILAGHSWMYGVMTGKKTVQEYARSDRQVGGKNWANNTNQSIKTQLSCVNTYNPSAAGLNSAAKIGIGAGGPFGHRQKVSKFSASAADKQMIRMASIEHARITGRSADPDLWKQAFQQQFRTCFN